MAKPWARYEVGFINHDKFRAIHANAIGLWLEGKNYADKNLTDGMLPAYEVKHWRFYSKKNVAMLTTSCGIKPGADQPYAPLWSAHSIGFQMHDYLEHNECREEALARIAVGNGAATPDQKRIHDAARQRKKRAIGVRSTGRESVTCHTDPSVPPDKESVKERDMSQKTVTQQITEDRRQKEEEREERARQPRAHHGTVFDGSLPRDHQNHVYCAKSYSVCVPNQVHAKFLGAVMVPIFGGDRQKAHLALLEWYAVEAAARPDAVMGDAYRFWQPLFDAKWATPTAAEARGAVNWLEIGKKGPSVRS